MKEIFSSLNYELNYKKDSNDIETIQDNLLGEVETGIQILCDSDIDSLTKDSPLHILRALYACKPFAICNEYNESFITKENVSKILGYKSDFANIFVYGKDSLSDTYLQARKALYKTIMDLREQREQEHKEEQERISQLSYKEYKEEQKEKERQERFSNRNTANKDSHLILESNDKNNVIIFLDSANSLSNLIHIHNERIDIFTKDSTRLDIQELESLINKYNDSFRDFNNTESNPIHNTQSDNDNIESKTNNPESNNQESKLTLDSLHSANTQIFLYSQLLLGSSETPNNPLFFGELDSKGEFRESKPIYHLIGETDYDTKDSKESFTQTLQIFLNNSTLTILNYSLLDSSLNIKLESKSTESKEILEREKAQKQKDSSLTAQNDNVIATAFLHPILEDDEIKCPHNGVVKLKSNKGKPFTSKGIPMILESDLLNSSIIGCTNPILSGGPCTMVATILPNARGLKKFNDDYPIMQDLVSSGVMSDKGFPLTCTPKENTFRINSPNPSNANTQSKEALSSQIDITIPSLTLITPYRDLEEYYFTPSTYENRESKEQYISSQSGFYTPNDTLEITLPPLSKNTDYARLDSNPTLTPILQDISKIYNPIFFSYRILTLRIAYTIYEYLLIVPKSMPKFIVKLLQEKRNKDELSYGYGSFIDLNRDYVRECDVGNKDGNKENDTEISLLHIQGKVLLAPNGCERVRVGVR